MADLDDITDLAALRDWTGRQLTRAVVDPKHGWHWPALGTLSQIGPELRTVVLRAFDPAVWTMDIYTDRRSAKVAQIAAQPAVQLLFYDPRKKAQLRVSGTGLILTDGPAWDAAWEKVRQGRISDYAGLAPPGTVIDGPDAAAMDDALASENFAVISVKSHEMDFLHLGRARHKRARLALESGSDEWLMP